MTGAVLSRRHDSCPEYVIELAKWSTKLVARLNGAFGGILADESFVLSQSYYFGSVRRNPSHQVVTVEGRPIDEATELDAIARYKRGKKPSAAPTETPPGVVAEVVTGAAAEAPIASLDRTSMLGQQAEMV